MQTDRVRDAYGALVGRPARTEGDLEALLVDWDVLWAEVSQEEIDLRLDVHRGRQDPAVLTSWHTGPGQAAREGERALRDRVLGHAATDRLPLAYAPFLRQLQTTARLEVPANDAPNTEIERLGQRWWVARRQVQPVADAYTARPCEETWRALAAARREVAAEVSATWTALLAPRRLLAENAGFDDYVGYGWAFLGRTWSVRDADLLCERVQAHVVPALAALEGPIDPWEELPVEEAAPTELRAAVARSLGALGPDLAARFEAVQVEIDQKQRGGAFHVWRPHARRSVVMLRPTGRGGDLGTLVHEAGHALHADLAYRSAPMRAVEISREVCELASCGLERLVDGSRAEVVRTLRMICSSAAADRFQHWAYAHPDATVEERCERWSSLWRAAFPHRRVHDDSGAGWVGYPHLTLYPFYCLEYTLAGLGALGLARAARDDLAATVGRYLAMLALPPGTPAAEAYAAAGVPLLPGVEALTVPALYGHDG